MSNNYKVLGQLAAAATTQETIYQVPADKEAVLSTIVVCNRTAGNRTYRLSVNPQGTAVQNQHYLVFDATIPAQDTVFLTIGVTMDELDSIQGYASAADSLTFQAFGSEITL
jgi:hypothetical protein